MELGQGNAKEGRSTSLAANLWIKTYQNALKNQINPKANLGLFFLDFFEFRQEKISGWIRVNQCC
jgi:hypothetical protein